MFFYVPCLCLGRCPTCYVMKWNASTGRESTVCSMIHWWTDSTPEGGTQSSGYGTSIQWMYVQLWTMFVNINCASYMYANFIAHKYARKDQEESAIWSFSCLNCILHYLLPRWSIVSCNLTPFCRMILFDSRYIILWQCNNPKS